MKTTPSVEREDGGHQNTWAFSRQYYCYNGVSYKRLDNFTNIVPITMFFNVSLVSYHCVSTLLCQVYMKCY